MGQKVHPNGFRVGISKAHDTIWFADYKTYAKILEEDYKIRSLFKRKFESIYVEAGIGKLIIRRRILQLELVIYVKTKKEGHLNIQDLAVELKRSLENLFQYNEKIRILILETKKIESYLVAKFISQQLEKRIRPSQALNGGIRIAEESTVSGFKIQLKGRLSGGPNNFRFSLFLRLIYEFFHCTEISFLNFFLVLQLNLEYYNWNLLFM
jgi:small subunit ribosomal protein S3